MKIKMSAITKIIGERLRVRRLELGYSQEKAAEIAGLHPTYIGQVERGEKNATIESIEKICIALQYPMDRLFKNITDGEYSGSYTEKCCSLLSRQSLRDQEQLCQILTLLIQYKKSGL